MIHRFPMGSLEIAGQRQELQVRILRTASVRHWCPALMLQSQIITISSLIENIQSLSYDLYLFTFNILFHNA